jgi:hypothetical protein
LNRSKEKVLREPYLDVAAVAEEEAGVNGGGGDRWSRERTME